MNLKLKYVFVLIGLFGLCFSENQDIYSSNSEKYCSKVDEDHWNMDSEQRTKKRDDNKTPFAIDFDVIKEAMDSGDYNPLFQKNIVVIIIIFLMGVLALLAVPFYIITCCCKMNKGDSKKTRFFFFITVGLYAVFLIFFIVLIVFIAKVDGANNELNCVLAKLPNDILNGVESKRISFIGFYGLQDMVSTFNDEISNLQNITQEFDNISSSNLDTFASAATDSVKQIYLNYKSKTTVDGIGKQEKPLFISNMTEMINDGIKLEFETYTQVAVGLHNAAIEGRQYSNSAKITQIQNIIKEFLQTLNDYLTPIDDTLGKINGNMDNVAEYVPIAYWFVLALGIFLLLGYGFMIFVLYKQSMQGTCFNCTFLAKLLLIVFSVFTLAFGIFTIMLMIGSTLTSSFCDFQTDLMAQSDYGTYLASFNINLSPQEIQFLNECLPENASGDLMKILDVPSFDEVQTFLDGVSGFNNLGEQLSEIRDSVSIPATIEVWQQFGTGEIISHENQTGALASLNDMVSCDDLQVVLNSDQCDGSNCLVIATSSNWTPPGCVSSPTSASDVYQKLKNSFTENQTLIGEMVDDLGGDQIDKPNSKLKELQNKLVQTKQTFEKIEGSLSKTLGSVQDFTSGLNELLDCRIAREKIYDLESGLCFTVRKSLYLLFTFVAVITAMMLSMNMCICCTLSGAENSKGKVDNFKENAKEYQPAKKEGNV